MNDKDDDIIVEQIFDKPVEEVWQAITVLGKMQKWFFENIPSFEPVVGFETKFVIQVEGRIFPHLWKVTEVVLMKKITYDWRYEGYPGVAIVDFELIEEKNQTKLRLSHIITEKFPDNIPEFSRQSGVEGWNYFIKNSLKNYLEQD